MSDTKAADSSPESSTSEEPIVNETQENSETPNSEYSEESDELDPGTMKILGIVCVVLWIVAVVLIFYQFRNARTDLYLGNLNQSMLLEGKVKDEDVKALVDMGPKVVPVLKAELDRAGSSGALCVAITVVLGKMDDKESLALLRECLEHPNDQVRPNAVVQLLNRGEKLDIKSVAKGLFTISSDLGKGQIFNLLVPRLEKPVDRMELVSLGLNDKNPDVRFKAFGYLYGLNGNPFKIENRIMKAPPKMHSEYATRLLSWASDGADLKNTPSFPEFKIEEKPVESEDAKDK